MMRMNPSKKEIGIAAVALVGVAGAVWWMSRASKRETGTGAGLTLQTLPLPRTTVGSPQWRTMISIVQKQLRALGYRVGRTDGGDDPLTSEAGNRFLAEHPAALAAHRDMPRDGAAILALNDVYRAAFAK